MIPRELTEPHYEVNEDGRRSYHEGYEERKCQRCGVLFICAKTSTVLVCGDKNCGEKKDDLAVA